MKPSTPFVSIIIPIRNEILHIEQCLIAIMHQDYPSERMEVLIIDADSDDGCDQLILDFAKRHSEISIRLLQKTRHIIPVGLNIGIRAAKGSIIVRVDARTVLASDYVSNCARYLLEGKADNVGGLMRPVGINYIGKGYALAACSPFGAGDAKFHFSGHEQYVDTVYLGAFWRKTFDEIGLYDESHVSEDSELNYRLREAGRKILLSPAIKSTYTPRSSLSAVWRQYFTYGQARARTLQKRPASLRWRQTVSPLFVAALFGSLLLTPFLPLSFWLFAFVVGSYLLASLIATIIVASRGGWQYLPILPIIFIIIHFAWGIGVWYGLMKILFGSS